MGLDSRDYYRPSSGFSLFPPMIKNLLIINVVVFFIQKIFASIAFSGIPGDLYINLYFALNPLFGMEFNFQIWQLFTYQFMHGDFMHIFFNMLMLWMFGMEIENIMGSKKFLVFYLVCGVGAGILQLLGTPILSENYGFTIGASGAVYGVMIAFAMFFPDRYVMFYFLIPVKAKYLITFLIILEFISVSEASFVAHLAHIGGAITGFIFLLIDRKKQFDLNRMVNNFKKRNDFGNNTFGSRYKKKPVNNFEVEDAQYYDINETRKAEEVTQEEIDKILDKISKSGYQGLSDREKRILFEASKKK